MDQNMGDTTWAEENVLKIISTASNVTREEKENVYQSQIYCLNV